MVEQYVLEFVFYMVEQYVFGFVLYMVEQYVFGFVLYMVEQYVFGFVDLFLYCPDKNLHILSEILLTLALNINQSINQSIKPILSSNSCISTRLYPYRKKTIYLFLSYLRQIQ